ncbi:MAG TPA: lysophospholipid acyltransferase family protein [Anaerolineaceae bacterium]
MKRQTLYKILKFLIDKLTRTEYYGLENVPPKGGVIIATNHLSRMDALLLVRNPVRDDTTALVADKYKKIFPINWITKTMGVVYIDREKADFTAFREAIERIKAGVAMGIAPEGTRSQTGGLIQGKPGVLLLAMRAGVPIVPVGISGTAGVFPKIFTLQRPRMVVRYGPAFTLPPLGKENREEAMQRYTDEVMCRIAALLPPENRGVYADHPRLKELLAG